MSASNSTTRNKGTATDANNNNVASKKDTAAASKPQASFGDTLSFVFECGGKVRFLFFIGTVAGIANGLVYPMLAYLFSTSFSDISTASTEGNLDAVTELAYTFMIVGVYALVMASIQTWCFEFVAHHATYRFRTKWFAALLRMDQSFFDVNDTSGLAGQVGPASNKYRRGVGRKFGEGVQFLTTGVGGLVYGFYESWQVALVILCVLPVVALSGIGVLQINQTKGSRSAEAYKSAGSTAYSAVSSIKTVLSLNAVPTMIDKYRSATQEAFEQATGVLIKQGLVNGSMLASFMLLYAILTVFGSFLLYTRIRESGCDPSVAISSNESCSVDGPSVFGAMLGLAFAAQGVSQFGNFSEAFTQARVATHEALISMKRLPGAEEEIIYASKDDKSDSGATNHSKLSNNKVTTEMSSDDDEPRIKAILPKYEIDSTSETGIKPTSFSGAIEFSNIGFSYPTRPNETVLNGMNASIAPGQTVAFVGPSGSGKSTVVGLMERFYDPQSGSVKLDGRDLRELNVAALRGAIGYVGQEPALFATTIKANIQYGNPDATMEEIEEAARRASAHDFVSAFTDGYETQVGDKGSQLSGGQKQRIAIARVLVGKPQLLILDEASSALDAESELVVQEALDNILEEQKITTIIIAHRLSTIRNADVINVLVDGVIAESGTHDNLMNKDGYYKKLVDKQDGKGADSGFNSREGSEVDLKQLGKSEEASKDYSLIKYNTEPHIQFKNVTFAYPSRPKKNIFNDFNLSIMQGETVALCGPSGGGKSTTVGLLERFYDPSAGGILYHGLDLRGLNVRWYRDMIGYVGQEPVLFSDTIANNIAYGAPGATREQIELAAEQANAHDFITQFELGYDTPVGERGTQLSGGQKQRVAIARALVKKPEILILDEATSALDNESESIVQAAIDKLMESKEHTCIVIAHRLSTIRNADKIAFIDGGKVIELGSHDELVAKRHGRYRRLFESSRRETKMTSAAFKSKAKKDSKEEDEEIDWEAKIIEEEKEHFNAKRARQMGMADLNYFFIGSIGAIFAGSVFPLWGLAFSETINLLFRPVFACVDAAENSTAYILLPTFEDGLVQSEVESCQGYWDQEADEMRDVSFEVAFYWAWILVACMIGNVMAIYGFGMAAERLNQRVRDTSFEALLRQEVAYFDKRSVGFITSQLQDDAARIQAFSNEPVRSFLIAISSVLIGVTLSFVFMWPFAIVALLCVPVMGFATSLEMKQMLGEDESEDDESEENKNTPGGVIVETLLNMRTVSALTLENQRYNDYVLALHKADAHYVKEILFSGVTGGLSQFIQQWINGLQMWFGGYLLQKYPEQYELRDFLISNFAVLFALFGLGAAFQDISDKKEVEKSAGRIFHLLDRKSVIDPLAEGGQSEKIHGRVSL